MRVAAIPPVLHPNCRLDPEKVLRLAVRLAPMRISIVRREIEVVLGSEHDPAGHVGLGTRRLELVEVAAGNVHEVRLLAEEGATGCKVASRCTLQSRHTVCQLLSATERRELERLQVGTFEGEAGAFRRRTALTKAQRDILRTLDIPEPLEIQDLRTAKAS